MTRREYHRPKQPCEVCGQPTAAIVGVCAKTRECDRERTRRSKAALTNEERQARLAREREKDPREACSASARSQR